MKKLLGISLLSLVALGSVALAEGPGAPGTKGEGKWQHPARPSFEQIDANHDGKVTKDELAADMKKRFDEHFARMDKNGDGTLDRDELGHFGAGPGHHGGCRHGRGDGAHGKGPDAGNG